MTDIIKSLGISKWSAAWSFITDGWGGLALLICKAFTALLGKADREKLAKYADFTAKLALVVRGGIETFCGEGAVRDAGLATADAIAELSRHIEDGDYSVEELQKDAENIEKCVDCWRAAK